MDNDYLYIVGFLGLVLVSFVGFYLLTILRKRKDVKDAVESVKIELNNQNDQEVECDGDKCFIRKQPKYDKCDDEKCF